MKDVLYFLRNGYEDATENMKVNWKGVTFKNGGKFSMGNYEYETFKDHIYRRKLKNK